MRDRASALIALTVGVAVMGAAQGCSSSHWPETPAAVPSGWPVARAAAVVSSSFGERRGGSFHEGVDLAAPAGTPVRATADGVVEFAARTRRYGRCVLIDHGGGWETRYSHLRRIEVNVRRRVHRGDVIGTVGSSGNASGPHLHYEVLHDGRAVDPRPTLDGS